MKLKLVAALAVLCSIPAFAEVKWSYEGTTLTEILPEGSTDTPWVFKLPSSGKTVGQLQAPTTVGTSTHLDFGEGTLPEGAPEITSFVGKIFYNIKTLNTIVLPETLVSFGSQAFQSSGITSLTIPTSVTSIGTHFVYQCTSITNICFKEPAKVTNFNVTSIFNTSTIRWMNIPASVTSIGTALSALINKATVVVVFDGDLIETDTCTFRTDTGANYDDYLNVKFDYEGNPNWQAFVDNPEYVRSGPTSIRQLRRSSSPSSRASRIPMAASSRPRRACASIPGFRSTIATASIPMTTAILRRWTIR